MTEHVTKAHEALPIAVLGGAGGIGRVLVRSLRDSGHQVTVLDLKASLERRDIEGISLDASDETSVGMAMAKLATLHPQGIRGFVNLAGWNASVGPLAETETAYFDDVLAGNLRSCFLASKAAAPLICEGGAMVLCSSGLGQYIRPGFGPYAAAKAGVITLTKTFALELAPRIRVNAVAPGLVRTAFSLGGTGRSNEDGEDQVDHEKYLAATPLKRIAEPEDVAGPIRFLLGADSSFMTGQVLFINGGSYMP